MLEGWRVGKHGLRVGELRATQPEGPRKAPARKDTKRWCKGKVGREHTPSIVLRDFWNRTCDLAEPWYQAAFGVNYRCYHRRACTRCGKVLEHSIPTDECPYYVGGRP